MVNFDLSDNAETYIHRIGRTGRAGKTGTTISLVEPIDRRLLNQIEPRVNQKIEVCQIPDRTQVEAKRLGKLQHQVKESLAGERMASFLPMVRELSGEYEPLAIFCPSPNKYFFLLLLDIIPRYRVYNKSN